MIIYPVWGEIFNAFNATSFDAVKVVVLGQDPYHGPGQSHGLCFSVPDWVRQPPSLKNIFKELYTDVWVDTPWHWNLQKWTNQWVFLLNAILTVRAHDAASHRSIGWEQFTDNVISLLSNKKDWLVFLLWWSFAQSKRKLIDEAKHSVLLAPHPSPLSAYRGFFWCKHFSQTNEILKSQGSSIIDWQL